MSPHLRQIFSALSKPLHLVNCNMSTFFPPGTPCSIRRMGSPLSRSSSPSNSPKSTSRKQGRLRLPQLGSRHRLSNSKENLDGSSSNSSSSCKDSCTEPSTVTEVEPLGPGAPTDSNTQDSWSADASSSDCDVIMVNGLSQDSSQSNGHSETSTELDSTPHQRDVICLEPIYDLYAISVSLHYPLVIHYIAGSYPK